MKKTLVLLAMLGIMTTSAYAAEQTQTPQPPNQGAQQDMMKNRPSKEAMFEKRLGLTEVQKLKARQIRTAGHEQLKPIMDQIQSKRKEAEAVRLSRISVQAQEEKLTAIDSELAALEKQAQTIRKQNMKEFESILTKQQKKILKEMKNEGREKYHNEHPMGRPPMNERG
jgi:Spy/CpxP family protein refolding chaperone